MFVLLARSIGAEMLIWPIPAIEAASQRRFKAEALSPACAEAEPALQSDSRIRTEGRQQPVRMRRELAYDPLIFLTVRPGCGTAPADRLGSRRPHRRRVASNAQYPKRKITRPRHVYLDKVIK